MSSIVVCLLFLICLPSVYLPSSHAGVDGSIKRLDLLKMRKTNDATNKRDINFICYTQRVSTAAHRNQWMMQLLISCCVCSQPACPFRHLAISLYTFYVCRATVIPSYNNHLRIYFLFLKKLESKNISTNLYWFRFFYFPHLWCFMHNFFLLFVYNSTPEVCFIA